MKATITPQGSKIEFTPHEIELLQEEIDAIADKMNNEIYQKYEHFRRLNRMLKKAIQEFNTPVVVDDEAENFFEGVVG